MPLLELELCKRYDFFLSSNFFPIRPFFCFFQYCSGDILINNLLPGNEINAFQLNGTEIGVLVTESIGREELPNDNGLCLEFVSGQATGATDPIFQGTLSLL